MSLSSEELQLLLEEEAKLTPAPWAISFELAPDALTIGTLRENAKFEGDIDDFKQFTTISKCEHCAGRSREAWDDATCWTNTLEEFNRLIRLRNSFRAVIEEALLLKKEVADLQDKLDDYC